MISFIVLILSFILLLILNVPVAFAIGMSTLVAALAIGDIPAMVMVAQRMATAIDSFSLLAIPFFVLSGLLMGHGGIARRLIDFANALVGRFRGGLGLVNVLTCMLFGAISGSAAAAVSSIGGFMIPIMNKMGYHRDFNASVSMTAGTTGLLIPPSNAMIIYSLATGGGVSIAALFLAGFLPGILMGIGLMVVCVIVSIRHNYGKGEKIGLRETVVRFLRAIPSLMLIVIVLGGILGGVFTATEAAAIAVVYSFILSVFIYREIKLRDLPGILLQSGVTTSVVMFLVATSMAMSWILSYQNIPQNISAFLLDLSQNKIIILLIINLILLFVGCFMDLTPAILVFTPIFLPVVTKFGMNPIHFGIVMIMNLCIGLCTPPVGTCLFLACGIAETTMTKVLRHLIPFLIALFIVLMITTYVPWISLVVPRLFGFK